MPQLDQVWSAPATATAARGVTILIVDDDDDIASYVQTRLSMAGYPALHIANSGPEALQILTQTPVDLMLLDYKMPGMNGLDIVRSARDHGIDAPFIIMTACGNEKTAAELMRVGAVDYLPKDSSFFQQLPLAIERALEKAPVSASANSSSPTAPHDFERLSRLCEQLKRELAAYRDFERFAENGPCILLRWRADKLQTVLFVSNGIRELGHNPAQLTATHTRLDQLAPEAATLFEDLQTWFHDFPNKPICRPLTLCHTDGTRTSCNAYIIASRDNCGEVSAYQAVLVAQPQSSASLTSPNSGKFGCTPSVDLL